MTSELTFQNPQKFSKLTSLKANILSAIQSYFLKVLAVLLVVLCLQENQSVFTDTNTHLGLVENKEVWYTGCLIDGKTAFVGEYLGGSQNLEDITPGNMREAILSSLSGCNF